MTILSKKVGQRIRELRENRSLKQVELAELINMEPSNLSKLENGNQFPKEENIVKLAAVLNVEVKDLFNFGHIKTREQLLESINHFANESDTAVLEFIYKIFTEIKSVKK